MYLWQICLGTIVTILPISLLLRYYAEQSTYLPSGTWARTGKEKMEVIRAKSPFLFTCLAIEGTISNLALLGLIIAIPLYFLFKI